MGAIKKKEANNLSYSTPKRVITTSWQSGLWGAPVSTDLPIPKSDTYLFVYGDLMLGMPQHLWMNPVLCTNLGKSTTKDMFTLYVEDDVPKLTSRVRKYQVEGELYKVKFQSLLDNLDKHNNHPRDGVRRGIMVKKDLGGGIGFEWTVAFAYFYDDITDQYLNNEATIVDLGDYKKYVSKKSIITVGNG